VASYRKKEARDWAWANMRGVANVVNPTFTEDLSALNEKAIRYDVRVASPKKQDSVVVPPENLSGMTRPWTYGNEAADGRVSDPTVACYPVAVRAASAA
jgi:hypothetical protein